MLGDEIGTTVSQCQVGGRHSPPGPRQHDLVRVQFRMAGATWLIPDEGKIP